MTEQFFEKFESELGELVQKIEDGLTKRTVEQQEKFETQAQEIVDLNAEHLVKAEVNGDYKQEEDEKSVRIEENEELAKDHKSMEGGFILSSPFGLAIPVETVDAEPEEMNEELENRGEIFEKEGNNAVGQTELMEAESQLVESDGLSLEEMESMETETAEEIERKMPTQEIEVGEELPVSEQAAEVVDEPVVEEESLGHETEMEVEEVEPFPLEAELIEPVDDIEPEKIEPTGQA